MLNWTSIKKRSWVLRTFSIFYDTAKGCLQTVSHIPYVLFIFITFIRFGKWVKNNITANSAGKIVSVTPNLNFNRFQLAYSQWWTHICHACWNTAAICDFILVFQVWEDLSSASQWNISVPNGLNPSKTSKLVILWAASGAFSSERLGKPAWLSSFHFSQAIICIISSAPPRYQPHMPRYVAFVFFHIWVTLWHDRVLP